MEGGYGVRQQGGPEAARVRMKKKKVLDAGRRTAGPRGCTEPERNARSYWKIGKSGMRSRGKRVRCHVDQT